MALDPISDLRHLRNERSDWLLTVLTGVLTLLSSTGNMMKEFNGHHSAHGELAVRTKYPVAATADNATLCPPKPAVLTVRPSPRQRSERSSL